MKTILTGCYPHMPAQRVQVVPWGSPLDSPPAVEVAVARQRLAAEWGDGPLLVTLSRISPEKSQDALLRALLQADSLPEGLTVAIVGAPSYMMGQRFLAHLRRLAGRLKGVRVIFPGHLGGAEKRAALELATVFVVCSRHESYGLTIMEAMQAGCPIVGVRSYGVEATVDEACGRVVSDGRGLWTAIEELLGNRALAAELGRNAALRASGETFQRAAERVRELCQGSHRRLTLAT